MDALAMTGGLFALIYVFLKFLFGMYVPWLMHSESVRLLFKVDPRKPKKKRSERRLLTKEPDELLKEAKENQKALVWMTSSVFDRLVLSMEALFSGVFSCRGSKFARIVNEGTN